MSNRSVGSRGNEVFLLDSEKLRVVSDAPSDREMKPNSPERQSGRRQRVVAWT